MRRQDWIDDVCRRFSLDIGWPLSFEPIADPDAYNDAVFAPHDSTCWCTKVMAGATPVGRLTLGRPHAHSPGRDFLRVCDMADLLARLISRGLTPPTGLERSRERSVRWPMPCASVPCDGQQEVEELLDGLLIATGFRGAAVFVLDPEDALLRLHASRSIQPLTIPVPTRSPEGLGPDAVAICQGSLAIHAESQRSATWLPSDIGLGYCQSIRVRGGGTVGTLWVYDRRHRRPSLRDRHAVAAAASRLSLPLERGLLLQDRVAQHQLCAELRVASDAYASPDVAYVPADRWCEVAARSESHSQVGGDLCEVIPLSDDRLLIAVGDAAGHSIPAAMVMATVRGALRALADEAGRSRDSVARLMTRINRTLNGIVQSHQFMTLVCGVLDRRRESISLTNAGHPAPLLLRAGRLCPLEAHGLLLGVVPDATYDVLDVPLREGDLLVIYTDGLSDAAGQGRQMFREAGLVRALRKSDRLPPGLVVRTVWDDFESHLAGSAPADDRTLLAVRFGGAERSAPPADHTWPEPPGVAAQGTAAPGC